MSGPENDPIHDDQKVSTSISISSSLLAKLRKQAKSDRRSVSSQLEMIVEADLTKRAKREELAGKEDA